MGYKSFITAFIACICIFSPSPSSASIKSACISALTKTKDLVIEIKNSRGRIIFLRAPKPEPTLWGGLLVEADTSNNPWMKYLTAPLDYLPKKIAKFVFRQPTYQTSFTNLIYTQLVNRPFRYLVQRVFNAEYELNGFSKFTTITAASIFMFTVAFTQADEMMAEKTVTEIVTNAAALDSSLKYDFRFHEIEEKVSVGEIDKQRAEREAFFLQMAYDQYYSYRDAQGEQDLEDNMRYLNHILFSHLQGPILDGVHKAPGFIVPDNRVGPLSDRQKLRLFEITHRLYLEYQLIIEFVNDSDIFHKAMQNADFAKYYADLKNDEFTVALYELLREGTITKNQLQKALQEEAFWRTRLKSYEILGITRLKQTENPSDTTPLSLSDVRSEILASLVKTQ